MSRKKKTKNQKQTQKQIHKQTHKQNSNQTYSYVDSHGAKIHYQIIGNGFPLVLLHGNGESHKNFQYQIQYFKNDYQLILIDSRAHGKSTWNQESLSISLLAHDVIHVLNELKIKSAAILGFSDGANIAFQIALRYPNRVSALVAVSGNIFPRGMRKIFYLSIVIEHRVISLFSRLFPSLRHHQQLMGLMALQPQISFAQLNTITAPTLIMAGDKDLIETNHTKAIASAIPSAKLVILSGADHFGLYNQPDQYNKIIADFLKEVITD